MPYSVAIDLWGVADMNRLLCALGVAVALMAGPAWGQTPPSADAPYDADAARARLTTLSREAFLDDLLARMTVADKIGQLRLISVGGENPREKVMADIRAGQIGIVFNTVVRPGIRLLQDQSLKSRLQIPVAFAYDVVHGHRTAFPISLGLASSFDLDAVGLSARIAAVEASADGLDISFSPMVDVTRDPRWGRTSEGFGEDTLLVSQMGAAMVRAYQKDDLTAPDTIMAAVKHYALYGAIEGGRDYNTVDMSPQRMFQDYLPPYKAAIDAGAGGVMVSLNSINGVPASADPWLLKDLLRDRWGFKGATFSDHGAILELVKHGVAGNTRDAGRLAIRAGVDLSMNDVVYGEQLPALLKDGEIDIGMIDRSARHVLRLKYDLGLFHDRYRRLGLATDPVMDDAATNAESRLHRQQAREVARKSLVLLKNENQTLPLRKQGTIAVVGPLAKSQRDIIGSWSAAAQPRQAVSVYQGLVNAVGKQATLTYARGANVTDDRAIQHYLNEYLPDLEIDARDPQAMIDEAVTTARQADVVLAVVGEAQGMAHEASSRTDIVIPESQRKLLQALKATGRPLVIVLMNGRPLALNWEHENADAMLETWFAGTEGGNAIADVLFGDYNPSGKLPMTFPRSVGQVPIFYNHLNTGRPFDPEKPNKYTSRYFDSVNGPLYPFGYGLSYTQFSLSEVSLSTHSLARDATLKASITVTNTGSRAGETAVQLYTRDLVASISRPVRELKHFQKIMLQAGESRVVTFDITPADLQFYNAATELVLEPGEFQVFIGLDSRDTKMQTFTLL